METERKSSLSLEVLKKALGDDGFRELLAKYEQGKAKYSPGRTRQEPSADQIRIAEFLKSGGTVRQAREKFGVSSNGSIYSALSRTAIWRYFNNITD